MFIRSLSKRDLSNIVYMLEKAYSFTFPQARKILQLNAPLTKEILGDLVFISILKQDGETYTVDTESVRIWRRYNLEVDYRILSYSDFKKTYFKNKGICVDVPTYEGRTSWDAEE